VVLWAATDETVIARQVAERSTDLEPEMVQVRDRDEGELVQLQTQWLLVRPTPARHVSIAILVGRSTPMTAKKRRQKNVNILGSRQPGVAFLPQIFCLIPA
jgi:hypothetical protein